MSDERYRHHKAPLTPFAWACVVGFISILGVIALTAIWLLWELRK